MYSFRLSNAEHHLHDASAIIVFESRNGNARKFELYRGLIERISPTFFSSIVEPWHPDRASPPVEVNSSNAQYYRIREEVGVLEDELDVLRAYLLHDIDVYTAPFQTLLALFIATSSGKCNFPGIHASASKRLEELVFQKPDLLSLRFDLLDGGDTRDEHKALASLERPLEVAESSGKDSRDEHKALASLERSLEVAESSGKDSKLSAPLRSLLYYAYTILDDSESSETGDPVDEKSVSATQKNVPGSQLQNCKTHVTHVLTEKLSEAISPALFTPPAAQHMPCTNVIAHLWSSRAVLPALTSSPELSKSTLNGAVCKRKLKPKGMADVFGMLGTWVEDNWADDEIVADGSAQEPCEECLEFLREEWRSEARAIWTKMGKWIEEAERQSEDQSAKTSEDLNESILKA